jgi:general transcription factor 3C polypeptide 3 (transcription factor C subunit 4)
LEYCLRLSQKFQACAVYVKDYETVVAISRKLINSHQFNNEPPRLLLAALASGLLSVDAFIDSRLQKHISREVRLADSVAKGKEIRWNPHNRRYHLVGVDEVVKEDVEEPEDNSPNITAPDKPTKHNPVMVCIYGQLCVAARSYQSGICASIILMPLNY